ncbi:NADH:flavin oxidoreductase/NADH oxidase [Cubamyces lactineus]|nr:NADH:flavin oxidoreductase/NADH oxidase [Cubamyces lactineus]
MEGDDHPNAPEAVDYGQQLSRGESATVFKRHSNPEVSPVTSLKMSTEAQNDVPKLFQPVRVGDLTLAHRIVLAPLTRCRADKGHVPNELMKVYYTQRASTPGTLLISESALIAPRAGGLLSREQDPHVPGIWSEEQIAKWKAIVDGVHAKGSFMYLQVVAMGRAAQSEALRSADPELPYVAPSAIALQGNADTPRALTIPEIKEYIELFAQAALNAVQGAGFDGVEIHGANGYLIDQFIQDTSNQRTDEYGGSIENRCRFVFEVVTAVGKAIGFKRTALRLSPWSTFQDMRMTDPIPTFAYLVQTLSERYPDLAYLHLIEPGIIGNRDAASGPADSNDFIRDIWLPRPLVSSGRFTRETAIERAEATGELIAFGRLFISNPDLPHRLREDLPLARWDRTLFYVPEKPEGYIDYPFVHETTAAEA